MNKDFTTLNKNAMWEQFRSYDNDIDEALNYLNNPDNFRSFSEGLAELLERANYDGEKTKKRMSSFVVEKLKEIGANITPKTVENWFSGTTTPDSKSRENIYKLCFALGLSIDDLNWFFQHVYFEKSFNYHTVNEAVFYFCFLNNKTYSDSVRLLNTIETYDVSSAVNHGKIYTSEIKRHIDNCKSEDEFLLFMKKSKNLFFSWNIKSKENIEYLINQITDSNPEKGLIQRELALGISTCEIHVEDIKNITVDSNDFMLQWILSTNNGLPKEANIPQIIKTNFPRKKYLSNVLCSNTSTSYDAIRKLLIILKFYHFWCQVKLRDIEYSGDLPDEFVDELNILLNECGYSDLIASNPFDWLIMRSSIDEDPIGFIRIIVSDIINNE